MRFIDPDTNQTIYIVCVFLDEMRTWCIECEVGKEAEKYSFKMTKEEYVMFLMKWGGEGNEFID
jgi:hypothetical protein